jgi:hypothetical protein
MVYAAPIVGVHIRHGDKGSEGGAMVGLDKYIESAASLMVTIISTLTAMHCK